MMNNLVISDIMSIFANSKRRRSQNLFYVYICKSTKQEGRGGECSPPLILYMEKEKAKKDVLEVRTSYL